VVTVEVAVGFLAPNRVIVIFVGNVVGDPQNIAKFGEDVSVFTKYISLSKIILTQLLHVEIKPLA